MQWSSDTEDADADINSVGSVADVVERSIVETSKSVHGFATGRQSIKSASDQKLPKSQIDRSFEN
jgi:hypothetical protein